MVTAKYTDNTQIQQAPSLNLGSGSEALAGAAAGKAQLIHATTKYVTDKIQKQTDIAAEEAGAKEGMKGHNAKTWSNLFEAGRAFNKGVAQTAPLMIGNDLTKYFSEQWAPVRQSNYSAKAYNDFKIKTEAYLHKYTSETPSHLRAAVSRAGIQFMGNYQTQFGKGFLNAQVEAGQLQSRIRLNTDINNVAIQAQAGMYTNKPKEWQENNTRVFEAIKGSFNLTPLQRMRAAENYGDAAITGILYHQYDELNHAWERAKNSNNPTAGLLYNKLENLRRNPGKWLKNVLMEQHLLNPEFQQYVNISKLNTTASKVSNQFKVKTSLMSNDLKTQVQVINDTIKAGNTPAPNVLQNAFSTLLQNGKHSIVRGIENNLQTLYKINSALADPTRTKAISNKQKTGGYGAQNKLTGNLLQQNAFEAVKNNGKFTQRVFNSGGSIPAFISNSVKEGYNKPLVMTTLANLQRADGPAAIMNGSLVVNPELTRKYIQSIHHINSEYPNYNAHFKVLTNDQMNGVVSSLHQSQSAANLIEKFNNLHIAGYDVAQIYADLPNKEQNAKTLFAAWNGLTPGNDISKAFLLQGAWDKNVGDTDPKYKGHIAVNSAHISQIFYAAYPPSVANVLLKATIQTAGAIHNRDEVGSLGDGVAHNRLTNVLHHWIGDHVYDSDNLVKIGKNIMEVYGKHTVPGFDVIAPRTTLNPLHNKSSNGIEDLNSLSVFYTNMIQHGKFYYGDNIKDFSIKAAQNWASQGTSSQYFDALGGASLIALETANFHGRVISDGGSGWQYVTQAGTPIFYANPDGTRGNKVGDSFYNTYAKINDEKG